ncbi:hypothetical protein EV356DRAFT_146372 [Viridothelium virens]|uniref:Uncharacterized protein n=1 Tax=Viridothelium virens TaxID=1048519 RepID=A0A6A6H9C9_VIRVR|nr:hypothetical protein EV356DRAFT_146372 [Viridothelium virens]
MSLLKGIQSAIFYYLSCAPCTQFAHKKRRRKQAQLDRAEREMLEIEQPGLYRHPSPFATNPYWGEEIALGPGPPPRRTKKKGKDTTARGIVSASTQSTQGSISNSDGETEDLDRSMQADRRHSLNPKHWNFRRYQREDEALWGQSFDKESTHGSSQAPPGSKGTDTSYSRTEMMYIARNPPVNDLHPPVVSTPSSNLNETRWMLQPPPRAKVMSGQERANSNRSRSSTTVSRNGSQLRIPHLKRPNTPEGTNGVDPTLLTLPLSRDPSFNNSITPSRTSSSGGRPRRRPDPITTNTGSPRSSATAVQGLLAKDSTHAIEIADFANPSPHPLPPQQPQRSHKRLSTIVSSESAPAPDPSHPASRPLSHKENQPSSTSSSEETIASSDTGAYDEKDDGYDEYDSAGSDTVRPHRHRCRPSSKPLVVADSSLQLLEELVSPAALLNSRFVKAPAVEARISLPPTSSVEELQLQQQRRQDEGAGLEGKGTGTKRWEDWLADREGLDLRFPWGPAAAVAAEGEAKRKDSGMMDVSRESLPRDPRARWSMDI